MPSLASWLVHKDSIQEAHALVVAVTQIFALNSGGADGITGNECS